MAISVRREREREGQDLAPGARTADSSAAGDTRQDSCAQGLGGAQRHAAPDASRRKARRDLPVMLAGQGVLDMNGEGAQEEEEGMHEEGMRGEERNGGGAHEAGKSEAGKRLNGEGRHQDTADVRKHGEGSGEASLLTTSSPVDRTALPASPSASTGAAVSASLASAALVSASPCASPSAALSCRSTPVKPVEKTTFVRKVTKRLLLKIELGLSGKVLCRHPFLFV